MSTALSKVRGNSAYKYYKFRMKRNSRAWIVALVLNLLGLPMMFIAQNIFYTNKLKTATDAGELFNQYETGVAVFAVIGIFCIAIAAIGGVFTVFASFDYLYNKSLVDMAYSAPLTGTARYTADFMAGLTTYLAPYLIGGVIGFIFGALTNLRIEEEYRLIPSLSTILPIFLGVGVAMIMAYALTTFVSICCGSLLEAVTYALVLNGIIPIAIAVTVFGAMNNIYGIFQEQIAFDLITVTSPLGVLIGTLGNAFGLYDGLEGNGNFIYNIRNIMPIILITAIAIIGAFLLNKRRKAEACGKPFVFKVLYYILISVVTYCVIVLHFSTTITNISIASALITSAVIYFILEVITNRGFKRFWLSAIRYVVTAVAIMIVVGPFVQTDAFGLFYKVPDVNSVRSVELTYNYYDTYHRSSDIKVIFKDKEKIGDITEFHEKILERYKTARENPYVADAELLVDQYYSYPYKYSFRDVNISYKMKSGTKMKRVYYSNDQEYELIRHLEDTDEFKDAAIKMVERNLTDVENISLIDEINEEYIVNINPIMTKDENLAQLSEAIAKDIRAGAKLVERDLSVNILGKLAVTREEDHSSTSWSIDITENHINIISYLTQKGYSSFFAADKDRFPNADTGLYYLYLIKTDGFLISEGDEDFYNLDNLFYSNILYSESNQLESVRGLVVNDKVRELTSKLERFDREALPDYMIKLGGKVFSVPEEYNSLADEVFDSNVAIDAEEFYKLLDAGSSEDVRDFIEGVLK